MADERLQEPSKVLIGSPGNGPRVHVDLAAATTVLDRTALARALWAQRTRPPRPGHNQKAER
jgi:hypothetical protein